MSTADPLRSSSVHAPICTPTGRDRLHHRQHGRAGPCGGAVAYWRYRRLLGTKLSDVERQFIERRLSEEQTALQALAAEKSPSKFRFQETLRQTREPSHE
jgi:hypothetical protein